MAPDVVGVHVRRAFFDPDGTFRETQMWDGVVE